MMPLNLLLGMIHLALLATIAYCDCDDCARPTLRYANDEAFFENVQTLCLAKKSQGIKGLVVAQVNVAGFGGTIATNIKFDVDCTRADNNYRDATVESCIYDDDKFGRLVLPARASRSKDAERVLNMYSSGGALNILIHCLTKGAASAELVDLETDPLQQRGIGPIHSVRELCIVNRGQDVFWGVYDNTHRTLIPVTFKIKCYDINQPEIASCTAGPVASTGGSAITLNAGTGATTRFWYQGQDNRPQRYTLSCDKSKGAIIGKTGVAGNAIPPFTKPSQHKAQALKADEKPTRRSFFRLDK